MAEDADLTRHAIPGYELLRPIGRGGMGVAFLARQLSLGRRVVVKFLNRDPDHDPLEQAARFRREAELMARVSHPNIATIFDYGIDDGQPFLVMEYVEGGDLRSHLVPGKPLSVERIRTLLGPLVQALECLHQYGILHLDLKPENILMARDDAPKVSDFGIAVPGGTIGSLAEPDQFLGTIGYVAPEQQYRLPVDERSDQYSLAALCYEFLTGQLPLGAFPLPSRENPRLQVSVDAVIERALSEDRNDRFPTIGEFGAALDRALAVPRKRRSRPWVVTAAALLTIGSLLASLTGRRNPPIATIQRHDPAPPRAWAKELTASTLERPAVATPRAKEVPPVKALAPDRPRPFPPTVSSPAGTSSGPVTIVADSLGIMLVLIPEGTFLMGTPDSEPYSRTNERPAHRVKIKHAFYLGAYEVTVGQFRAFVDATGYLTKAERDGKGGAMYDRQRKEPVRRADLNWRNPGFRRPQAEDEPVVQVSWDDANAFCKWLSEREGVAYRLPTEAEWEYACRAGSQSTWSFGNDPDCALRICVDQAQFRGDHPAGRPQGSESVRSLRHVRQCLGMVQGHLPPKLLHG